MSFCNDPNGYHEHGCPGFALERIADALEAPAKVAETFTIEDMDRAYDAGFEAAVRASRDIVERAVRLLDEDLRVQERPTHDRGGAS